MMRNKMLSKIGLPIAISVLVFGFVVAKTVTRPLDVDLRIHIKICQKTDKGRWEVVDEVGPKNLKFTASLHELATGKNVGTDFVWTTKTKKGRSYSARVLQSAKVDVNPVTGKFKSEPVFEIKLDGKTAKVPAKYTTEAVPGPLGTARGKRAKGVFGKDRTTVTLVGVLKFQPAGESVPLLLVSTEEYKLSPKR
ncbi:MAG: hypothetical protein ACE5HS_21560 [bacterium]